MAGDDIEQTTVPLDGHSSEWSFNWPGVIALVVIASLAVVGWRWFGGTDEPIADQLSVVGTSVPSDSVQPAVPTTGAQATTPPPLPSTTLATTTSTTVEPERRVLIRGEMKPCRYGDRCLVASFTIEGFDEHPGRFTCIYPNSQSEFSFRALGVDEACLTADEGDTLTIEVGGVKSATISEENLDGI